MGWTSQYNFPPSSSFLSKSFPSLCKKLLGVPNLQNLINHLQIIGSINSHFFFFNFSALCGKTGRTRLPMASPLFIYASKSCTLWLAILTTKGGSRRENKARAQISLDTVTLYSFAFLAVCRITAAKLSPIAPILLGGSTHAILDHFP